MGVMNGEKKTDKLLLEYYHDPESPGSYGGVERFSKENRISLKRAKRILEKYLGYTVHKQRRRKFPTLPVVDCLVLMSNGQLI